MSLYAVEEYESLQENLNLEKDLRAEAENFAREVNHLSFSLTSLVISLLLSVTIIGLAALDGYFGLLNMSSQL